MPTLVLAGGGDGAKLTLSAAPPGHGEPFPGCRARLPPPAQDEARFCASPLAVVIFPRLPRGPQEEANSISTAGNSPKGVQSYELKCWGFTFHTVFTAKLMVRACPSQSCQQPAQFFPSGQHTSPSTAALGTLNQLSIPSCVLRCRANPLGFGALLCVQAL